MTLTLAIPVHNDAEGLARLLARAAPMGCIAHVVVVDDGSDTPLEAAALTGAAGLAPDRLTLLRHDSARGPGAARNRALEAVNTPHLLFMDADDLPTVELGHLMADLEGRDFDFCLVQHHDTRAEQEHRWGQMPWDQGHWRASGTDLGALTAPDRAAAARLAQTANYPWNKIYRTAFLRDHGIGCTEMLVHEDVELHWRSFLCAETVLASDRVCVIHHVAHRGARLTNRRGAERLEVFAVFAELAREAAGTGFARPFYRFALGLCLWIEGNIAPEHHPALARAVVAFLAESVPDAEQAALRADDPALMERIAALASDQSGAL